MLHPRSDSWNWPRSSECVRAQPVIAATLHSTIQVAKLATECHVLTSIDGALIYVTSLGNVIHSCQGSQV